MQKYIRKIIVLYFILSPSAKALAEAPRRIASGTVGSDEILLELLKGEEQRLVAVSTFADNPKYSFIEKLPPSIKVRVGDSMENLLLAKPDLVILASYTSPDIIQQLKNAKVNVAVQRSFGSLRDIEANIAELGRLTGEEKPAAAMVARMQAEVRDALAQAPRCVRKKAPTFIQYTSSDVVPGAGTIIDDVANIAGYHNALRDIGMKDWSLISHEVLAQQRPDYVFASEADAPDAASLQKVLLKKTGWQRLEAVRKGRIIMVPDRLLYTVSFHITELVRFLTQQNTCPKT